MNNHSTSGPFYSIHPLYERLRHLRGSIILVEGIIGAGKSTLASKLNGLLSRVSIPSMLLEEDVDSNMLRLFLSDMRKYAFAFQMTMLVQRQKIYMKALDFARRENGVAIVDRSLWGDWAFANMHHRYGNIDDNEWNAYLSVMESTQLPQPSHVIYLDVSVETALARIVSRNRDTESTSYTLSYLNDLDDSYRKAMSQSPTTVSYVDWNRTRSLSDDDLIDLCNLCNL